MATRIAARQVKLQPKLRMVANGSTEVNTLRAEHAAVKVQSERQEHARAAHAAVCAGPGRDMLDALASDTSDPVVLSELARGRLRKKIPALREALVGRFDAEHALIVGPDPRAHRLSPTRRSSGCPRRSRSRSPLSRASVTY